MKIFMILFLCGTALDFILNQVLEFVDFFNRKKHGLEVPEVVKEFIDEEKMKKTVAYENDRYFLWIPLNILVTVLNVILVVCGFYPWIFEFVWNLPKVGHNPYWMILLFSFLIEIPETILSLPFGLYREFKIEKKYGFSKMTFKLLVIDTIKSTVLNLVLMVPLLCGATAIILHVHSWWLLLSAVLLVFSLGLSFIYPVFIAPIFNKFTPIENVELKNRLEALLEKTGFKASGIFVMDASKRSGHSNAYFTGFGKNKRIVLYDTLIQQLEDEEIEGVLAHELGHYKKHHIIKKMAFSIPMFFVSAFVLNLLVRLPSVYSDFGFAPELIENAVSPEFHLIGIFLLSMVFDGFKILISPLSNLFERKDEFEADAFSKDLCGSGKPLINALIKLNKENLSELTPPKIYSVFNYNHPPLLERISAVE